jgi:hypothetical protein
VSTAHAYATEKPLAREEDAVVEEGVEAVTVVEEAPEAGVDDVLEVIVDDVDAVECVVVVVDVVVDAGTAVVVVTVAVDTEVTTIVETSVAVAVAVCVEGPGAHDDGAVNGQASRLSKSAPEVYERA